MAAVEVGIDTHGWLDGLLCLQLTRRGLRMAENGNVVVYHPARDHDETRRLV